LAVSGGVKQKSLRTVDLEEKLYGLNFSETELTVRMPLKIGARKSQNSTVCRFTHEQEQCVLKLCLCKLEDIVIFVIVIPLVHSAVNTE